MVTWTPSFKNEGVGTGWVILIPSWRNIFSIWYFYCYFKYYF